MPSKREREWFCDITSQFIFAGVGRKCLARPMRPLTLPIIGRICTSFHAPAPIFPIPDPSWPQNNPPGTPRSPKMPSTDNPSHAGGVQAPPGHAPGITCGPTCVPRGPQKPMFPFKGRLNSSFWSATTALSFLTSCERVPDVPRGPSGDRKLSPGDFKNQVFP